MVPLMRQLGNRKLILAGCAAAVLLIVIGAAAWLRHAAAPAAFAADPARALAAFAAPRAPLTHPRAVPEGEREYHNAVYHFSLLYPDTLTGAEYDEAGGGHTITFEDADDTHAFQVYIVSYASSTISDARFLLDEPSGVRTQPTSVVIDGVTGTMFFGNNPVMGDTREVWFIHGGFLYEVTTYKDDDAWLAGIMQTWQFI
ncbi:MAG TPA: hypothetical protein VFL98_01525 [Candidatus Paceibacterota bacterium]|nr:hypothetical protein [Candidatus Paceibacterota bacterium]